MRGCLSSIDEKMEESKFIKVLAVAWAMWVACNDVVFNGGNPQREVMTQSYIQ